MRRIRVKGKTGVFKGYRPKEQIYSCLWEFHSYDADPSPSVPHGHSLDGKLKLSIWDGSVYDVRTRKRVGCATKKEMRKLQANSKFKLFVAAEREWYRNEYGFVPELQGDSGAINYVIKLAEYKEQRFVVQINYRKM